MTQENENIVVAEFAGAAPVAAGREIDLIAAGSWRDMRGRDFVMLSTELDDYVTNTGRAIESSRTNSGEIVGLPIDTINHNHAEAAGWIVGVRRDGNKIKGTPVWNEIGRNLIAGNVLRGFSATLNPHEKVILGGSLTNWAAVVNPDGTRVLSPVELSQRLEEQELSGGETLSDTLNNLNGAGATVPVQTPVATETRKANPTNVEELLEMLNLSSAQNDMVEAVKQVILDQVQAVQARAQAEVAQMMAAVQREAKTREFATLATGGEGNRFVFSSVKPEEITTFMLSLNREQYDFFSRFAKGVMDGSGIVDMREFGHGRENEGGIPLPTEFAVALENGSLTLQQLSNPILGLGDLSQYDLSKYRNGGK